MTDVFFANPSAPLWVQIVVALLVVIAAGLTAATAIGQWRAPDPLTRVNLMGPLVGVALPLLLLAKLLWDWSTEGFDLNNLLRAVVACAGLWIISSVGSFYMGRAVYGVTVVDGAASDTAAPGNDAPVSEE